MKSFVRIVVFVFFMGIVACIGPCRFSSYSICRKCGATQLTINRQLPFVRTTYWTTNTIARSPVVDLALVGAHTHDWVFAQGGGNGIACALGHGTVIRQRLSTDSVQSFLEDVVHFDNRASASEWLRRILDVDEGRLVVDMLYYSGYPDSGFDNSGEYFKWKTLAEAEWQTLLDYSKSPRTTR